MVGRLIPLLYLCGRFALVGPGLHFYRLSVREVDGDRSGEESRIAHLGSGLGVGLGLGLQLHKSQGNGEDNNCADSSKGSDASTKLMEHGKCSRILGDNRDTLSPGAK